LPCCGEEHLELSLLVSSTFRSELSLPHVLSETIAGNTPADHRQPRPMSAVPPETRSKTAEPIRVAGPAGPASGSEPPRLAVSLSEAWTRLLAPPSCLPGGTDPVRQNRLRWTVPAQQSGPRQSALRQRPRWYVVSIQCSASRG